MVKLLAKGIPGKKNVVETSRAGKRTAEPECIVNYEGHPVPKEMSIKRISLKQVNELLNYGASPTVENPDQEMLVGEMPMETILSERIGQAEPSLFEEQLVEFIVTLLMFIITYTSIPGVKDFMDNIARRLNDIDSEDSANDNY